MKYHFTIQYYPGKWHHVPDVCPQNPTQTAPHHSFENNIWWIITDEPTETDIQRIKDILNHIETSFIDEIYTLNAITNMNCSPILTHKEIIHAYNSDPRYQILLTASRRVA